MAEDKASKAIWVRENLPTCAAVAARFAEEFPGCRMVFANENGNELGQRSPDGVKMSETCVGPLFPKKPEGRR